MGHDITLTDLAHHVLNAAEAVDRRWVVGIAGPPAAGKSTLSEALADAINALKPGTAQIAPMDGFHRTNAELRSLGALHRKGEPDTFAVAEFVSRLRRLHESTPGTIVSWPAYDRALHDPVPDKLQFDVHRIAVVEGNYLLLDDEDWRPVRTLLDEAWFLSADESVIEQRLIDRHLRGGKPLAEAQQKVASSDLPNARLVAATSGHADLILQQYGDHYRAAVSG
ncbi:nucleoside/nucleotide kinase family protein [Nocardia stercoris]|uniref:Nucleoside/nucleotide kinase family protein n=1 Tax=Nocardia stercoris TaxID=2483361 RepID=A0A3M2L7J2_9NOCA|nr:nucleoside/nucleotide kinase family protein [Nocardia stercoris]RMI32690.1 nucleoside/nucleotide kinase family protein [Nocardia stercoris]